MTAGAPADHAGVGSAAGFASIAAHSHELRASLSAEMHDRRLPRISAPARLMQVVTLLGEHGLAASREHVGAIAGQCGIMLADRVRHAVLPLGAITLVWEGHSEFATYTFVREGPFPTAFDPAAFGSVEPIVAAIPGEIIRATQIAIKAAGLDPAGLESAFDDAALVVTDVAKSRARATSDFVLHDDGFGRLLIADAGLAGDELSQLVTRLQELGNYRNLALIGLRLAQQCAPDLAALEARLADLTHEISERDSDDETMLDELTHVSAALARLVAATRYRMSATRAYAQIAFERLASLDVTAVRGFQSLGDFTERRLVPAVRTCDSFAARLEELAERASRTSALLRTRIDIALARQNRDLLASMDRRTQLQLRLQQAVEGLSVVAITYYLVALIGEISDIVPGVHHALVRGIAVPIVFVGVTIAIWRFRRHLHN